ncbi:MAG: radical SAM protein [Peptococcaceae bacterium]|nr:radical SAM protein [Peptococcaceae bacterium]
MHKLDYELDNVTLVVTNECNLRCKHCYVDAGRKLENELSLDEIKDLLEQLYFMGVMQLDITGGEPLLRPDLEAILHTIREMGFVVTLLTNGTLLDGNVTGILSSMDIKFVQIPLEGMPENHEFVRGGGTFDRCVDSIRLLKRANIPVQVRTTVSKRSLNDLENLAQLLVGLNVDSLLLAEFIPVGRGMAWEKDFFLNKEEKTMFKETYVRIKAMFPELAVQGGPYGYLEGHKGFKEAGEFKKSFMCGLVRGDWCQIMPDGTVTPCDLIIFHAGNVRTQSMREIWRESPVFRAFRGFDAEKLKGSCGDCGYKYICGGCRALAFLYNGDFYAEDPVCMKV